MINFEDKLELIKSMDGKDELMDLKLIMNMQLIRLESRELVHLPTLLGPL
jgi:hypothetical protein